MTTQDTLISKKRRGPAPTGQGTPVLVRLQPDQLAKLDAIRRRGPTVVSRPEALRGIMGLVDRAVEAAEGAIELALAAGISPDGDGPASIELDRQIAWVKRNREGLALFDEERHALYDPRA